jgi:uncharacterized protein YycO
MRILTKIVTRVRCPIWESKSEEVLSQMKQFIKPGDIICRQGNAYLLGIWLSGLISDLTQSKYSHASMVVEVGDKVVFAEVDTDVYPLNASEWIKDSLGDDLLVLRPKISLEAVQKAVDSAKSILGIGHKFNFGFVPHPSKRYCVELIQEAYKEAGIDLCPQTRLNKMPGWRNWHRLVLLLNGIKPTTSVWVVGNEEIGLLSSPILEVIKVIPKPIRD